MTDIFLSYASADRERAAALAAAFEAAGWSVWWDRKIVAGQAFDAAIEQALDAARCVVVLWSPHAVASEWVKNEAAAAAERGVLVPAMIEPVKLPLEFRRKQTADLTGWQGDAAHAGFAALCQGVAAQVGGKVQPAPVMPARPAALGASNGSHGSRRGAVLMAACALVLLAAVAAWWAYSRGNARSAGDAAQPPAAALPALPAPPALPAQAASTPARPSVGAPPATAPEMRGELADEVVGRYMGAVVSDSKGSSRSDVALTVTKLGSRTVRVTSDYARIGSLDLTLDRVGAGIQNAGGDSVFLFDPSRSPPVLMFNPRNELAWSGIKR